MKRLPTFSPRLAQSPSSWARCDRSPCSAGLTYPPSWVRAGAGGRCGVAGAAWAFAALRRAWPLLTLALILAIAAVPAIAADSTSIPQPRESFGVAAARSFGALALVLACVVGLSYAARRLLRRTAGVVGGRQSIEIVASRSLGGRCSLTLVEVAGERILVGSTPQSLNLICRVGGEGDGGSAGDFDHLLHAEVAHGVRS